MLTIYVEPMEFYNETTGEFVVTKGQTLTLEHSLLSVSKWEAKWHEPFLSRDVSGFTNEKILDYIKCMTITTNVDSSVYAALSSNRKYAEIIKNYIQDPHTATTINNKKRGGSREIVTSELIYYWMIELGIPFSCEKWNLNRLMMLINVCGIKQTPSKKMSKADAFSQQRSLNAIRRAKSGSRG